MKTIEELMADILEVSKAERITKAKLGSLSRDLLIQWDNDKQPELLNMLMGCNEDGTFVLTPANWKMAAQYFRDFIGAGSNYVNDVEPYIKGKGKRVPLVFGEKNKNASKRTDKARAEWLADEANNLWTWVADKNLNVSEKDYKKDLIKAITACMDEKKGDMSTREVLDAILESELSMADLMESIDEVKEVIFEQPAIEQAA